MEIPDAVQWPTFWEISGARTRQTANDQTVSATPSDGTRLGRWGLRPLGKPIQPLDMQYRIRDSRFH